MKRTAALAMPNKPQLRKAVTHGRWLPRVAVLVLLSMVVLFVADGLYHPQRFLINKIEVHGQFRQVDGAQIKRVVEQTLSGNYFSLRLSALERRVEQLPWVFSTSMRRQWPDTLVVEVVEVQPVANWGTEQWLNFNGDLLPREVGSDTQNLPLLVAPQSHKETVWQAFTSWSEMLAVHGLRLQQLRFEQHGIWHLTLATNALAKPTNHQPVTITVAHNNAEQQMQRFVKALRQRLIDDFAAIRAIDLRYPNGFAIRWETSSPALSVLPQHASPQISVRQ